MMACLLYTSLPLFRAVPGPQTDAFTAVGQAAFAHGVYALTADCDRMACNLQGPQIETVDGSDIVSDGIVAGSVQVSANGQPIVKMCIRDRWLTMPRTPSRP